MAVNKSFAGTTYSIPQNKDPKSTNWGTQVSNFLQALADYALPRTGGDNQLTAEMNFSGASFAGTYGVKLPYLKAAVSDANLPAAGFLRLSNASSIQWKGSSTDLSLSVSGSDRLQFAGTNLYQPADADSANTASKLVLRDASGNFSAGTITATSFVGSFSGNATSADKWSTARTLTLGGDLGGNVTFDGSAPIPTLTATIQPDSVALGTDTTGNYIATIAGTTNQVNVSGSGSETAAVTLSLPQSIATTSSPEFVTVTLSGSVSNPTDAATKSYVDTVSQGLDVKPSVKAATTANITLSGTQTVDTIALSVGDRCLVKNQSTQANNGIYVVASSSWTRATDMDSWTEIPGAFCFVEQGSQADTGWVCTADQGGTLGSTAITFSQFSGVGAYQPLDATLTALAAYNTNGILTQTATDTFVGRTITGSTGITVSNGDGVSGNPSVAFNSTYGSETASISSNTITPTSGLTLQRITGSASDIQMVASPTSGKYLILINETGSDIQIKNDTGGTAANRIYTGTGADATLKSNASISIVYDSGLSRWVLVGSSGSGGGTTDLITQASHGFSVGNILYLNGSTYTKAIATAANTAEVVGMVSRVVDSSTFEITLSGEVTGLTSLTGGTVYFLSDSSAGAYTATEPTTIGYISVPLGVASSTTSFYVAPKRGNVIGGTNARTSIPLANNTTANIQDVSAYDAGELTGWISITATTPLKFFISAPFAKNGAANNWNISPSYVGDTPPSGFSVSITSAGIIQYTMPSVSGFSAATINYGLDVPAVGATFPLSISGTNVVNGTPQLDTINEYTSTNGVQIKGRGNNTAIASGYIGEKIEKKTTAATATPGANGGWGDATFSDATQFITLTAGCWSISAVIYFSGGTLIEQFYLGIGTASGSSATDIALGDNGIRVGRTATSDTFSLTLPNVVVNLNSSTNYRLKMVAYYPGGTNPNYQCRLTAIRIA